MIPVPVGVPVWLATGHTDMWRYAERWIMQSLRQLVQWCRSLVTAFAPHNAAHVELHISGADF